MFWIICAALAAIVSVAIAAPLLRQRPAGEEPAAAYDLRVYRDQLREVERDLERGLVEPTEAERLRNEIGRKVLAADRALARAGVSGRAAGGAAALAILAVLLAGAVMLYQRLGAPQMPDAPIAQRLANAEALHASRPTQSEAEKLAPKREPVKPDAEYAALIDQLRAAVAKNPEDPRGLALLAQHEERLGNALAAKDAQARLVAVRGADASAEDHLRLAVLTIDAAGGLITAEAESELTRALTLDPKNPQGRFVLGLMQIQTGRPDLTFPIWAELLAEGHDSAPWMGLVRASIQDLAWFAGQPGYTPPEPKAAPKPALDAGAMAAAQDMSAEERQQMIAGMVEGLETRLATEGGTPEEWARLISSLVVMGKAEHAQHILGEAQTRFAATPEALAVIDAAGKEAGLQ